MKLAIGAFYALLIIGAGLVAADAISIQPSDDAEADFVAVSGTGNAKSGFVAFSAEGDSEGVLIAVAPGGAATAPLESNCQVFAGEYVCTNGGIAVAGGDASGFNSVSVWGDSHGNAGEQILCSGGGVPPPCTSSAGNGQLSVSVLGSSTGYYAASGGTASGGEMGISAEGDATGSTLAVAPQGTAMSHPRECASTFPCTNPGIAVAGEDASGGLAISLSGNATSGGTTVCLTPNGGDCLSVPYGLAAVSGLGAANGAYVVASGAGDSTGLVAISGTGDSNGVIAVSATGHATGSTLSLSACDLQAAACIDPL